MIYRDQEIQQEQSNFPDVLTRVYSWMTLGLLLTAIIAWACASTASISNFIQLHPFAVLGPAIIAQFALVIALSAFIEKMSYPVAIMLFVLYSMLMGVTLSTVFKVYTPGSIAVTFFVTACMFGTMAIYGSITRRDLSQMGMILRMALFGLIIGLLVNLFLRSSLFDTVLSLVGVIVFAGLTAFDVQRIKALSSQMIAEGKGIHRIALVGALMLYLDFINLFLSLLRFTGKRRE
jgi:uncharacterized protein